jgi:hypothetical protein
MAENVITQRRTLDLDEIKWTVDEFDGGRSYILATSAPRMQFLAHFDTEQWAEFQKLVAGGRP